MFYLHRIIAALFISQVLSACGQKGPLFLAPQSVPYSLLPSGNTATPPAAPAAPASAAR